MPFFLLGFLYYLVSPPFVFHYLSRDNELLGAATTYFDAGYFSFTYFLDAAAILVSFQLGYFLGKVATKPRISPADHCSLQTSFPSVLAVAFGALILYLLLTAVMSGAGFFTGYSTYDVLIRGPISTSVFLSVWFANYFSRRQIRVAFLSLFAICSVVLLGWGSRLYFVLSLMALMLGLVSRNKKLLRKLSFYSFVAVAGLFLVSVGIIRQGEGGREFNFDNLIAILFAEPLFTAVSGSLYFEHSGGRPILGIPNDLIASVIHFVPSVVFPGKVELIREITFDKNIVSPFGARALMVSLYTNFGFLYPIFVASFGFYFGFLYKRAKRSVFYRATYFSALPILTLLFYREGLSTVIKVLFFNGLVLPLFVVVILAWVFPRSTLGIGRESSQQGGGENQSKDEHDALPAGAPQP